MTSESEKKPQAGKPPTGTGIAIGAALGVAFGALYGQLALALALGTAFGAAFDMVAHVRYRNND